MRWWVGGRVDGWMEAKRNTIHFWKGGLLVMAIEVCSVCSPSQCPYFSTLVL